MLAKNTDKPIAKHGDSSNKSTNGEQKHILVQSALRLFHEKGYGKVNFSHIAKAVGIANKEAQKYFSSKEDICHLVIDAHLANQKAQFEEIDLNNNPRQRLSLYLDNLFENVDSLIKFGCPLTNLYFDVKRDDQELADHAAELLLARLGWIREQFVLITQVEDIADIPERLASAIHGISLLAQVIDSEHLIRHQANQLKQWIRSM